MPLRYFNSKLMNFLTKARSTQLFISSPSSTQSRKCIGLLQTITALQQSSFFSSKSRKPRGEKTQEPSSVTSASVFNPPKPENESKSLAFCKKPGAIPFHSNVANSVDLIGFVDCPVLFEALPDGRRVAKTVVFTDLGLLPSVSIPVVFQGDLAEIAKFHVKENDCVYVSGQLSGDPLPSVTIGNQRNIHLLVQIMNFVVGLNRNPAKISGLENDDDSVKQKKGNKKKGFINGLSNSRKTMNAAEWKDWRDLIKNPKQWKDYRERKCNGSVKARHPDFKHKESSVSLWLSNAPEWVLPGLEGLEFNDSVPEAKSEKQVECDK